MKIKLLMLLSLLIVCSCSRKKEKAFPKSEPRETIDSTTSQAETTIQSGRFLSLTSDEPQIFESYVDPDQRWWDAQDMNLYNPVKRPKWSEMEKYYPRKRNDGSNESAEIYNLVGGTVASIYNADPVGSVNTCALRMSIALNKSGIVIPSIAEHTFKGKDGKFYFLSAAKFFHWVLESFGEPEFYNQNRNGFIWNSELDKAILGKKGIYIIQAKDRKLFRASGHADLFDGEECAGGHCYFNLQGGAERVALWILKD